MSFSTVERMVKMIKRPKIPEDEGREILEGLLNDSPPAPESNEIIYNYKDLEWDLEKTSWQMGFDASLTILRSKGYKRHARPNEVFSLLIK